ncbi:MAG: hypothetical protein ACJAWV_002197 [Flammeovirgaceae bacterium]
MGKLNLYEPKIEYGWLGGNKLSIAEKFPKIGGM